MLSKKNKATTRIRILTPDYVNAKLLSQEGTMIARSSFVYNFDVHSFVGFDGRSLDFNSGRLRGVAKSAAEGGNAPNHQEEVLAKLRQYVPAVLHGQFEQEYRTLHEPKK